MAGFCCGTLFVFSDSEVRRLPPPSAASRCATDNVEIEDVEGVPLVPGAADRGDDALGPS